MSKKAAFLQHDLIADKLEKENIAMIAVLYRLSPVLKLSKRSREEINKEEPGRVYIHSRKSGVSHLKGDTEEEVLMATEELLFFCFSTTCKTYRVSCPKVRRSMAVSSATAPRLFIRLRKPPFLQNYRHYSQSISGAYIVVSLKQTGSDVNFAYPTVKKAVMCAEGAVNILYRKADRAAKVQAI